MRLRIITAFLFVLTSCATMFNSPKQRMTIATNEPTKIIVNKVYSDSSKKTFNIDVPRSKNPLSISIISNDSVKNYVIKSHNSFAYWLNIYPSYGLGMLVDKNSSERYSYPRTIYIDFHSTPNKYLTYIPLDSKTIKLKNILKLTPLRVFALSNSSFELTFERKTGRTFSSQIMASYLLPESFFDNDFKTKTKGYRFAFEEKLYIKKSAPLGPYIAIELDHLKSKYEGIGWFGPKGINSDSTRFLRGYSDSISINKQTTSFNFKFGYQNIEHRVAYDFYCGIGARYRDVTHSDRINPSDEMVMPREPNFDYMTNRNRKNWAFVLLLNVRIGWIF